jgi:hypothetical protein
LHVGVAGAANDDRVIHRPPGEFQDAGAQRVT